MNQKKKSEVKLIFETFQKAFRIYWIKGQSNFLWKSG